MAFAVVAAATRAFEMVYVAADHIQRMQQWGYTGRPFAVGHEAPDMVTAQRAMAPAAGNPAGEGVGQDLSRLQGYVFPGSVAVEDVTPVPGKWQSRGQHFCRHAGGVPCHQATGEQDAIGRGRVDPRCP